jgi:hypothetical protein
LPAALDAGELRQLMCSLERKRGSQDWQPLTSMLHQPPILFGLEGCIGFGLKGFKIVLITLKDGTPMPDKAGHVHCLPNFLFGCARGLGRRFP